MEHNTLAPSSSFRTASNSLDSCVRFAACYSNHLLHLCSTFFLPFSALTACVLSLSSSLCNCLSLVFSLFAFSNCCLVSSCRLCTIETFAQRTTIYNTHYLLFYVALQSFRFYQRVYKVFVSTITNPNTPSLSTASFDLSSSRSLFAFSRPCLCS